MSSTSSTNCTANLQTDTANCGACGHSCVGGTCNNGLCGIVTVIADVGQAIDQLVVDDEALYFGLYNPLTVESLSKVDGVVAPVVQPGPLPPRPLHLVRFAVDAAKQNAFVVNDSPELVRSGQWGSAVAELWGTPPGSGMLFTRAADRLVFASGGGFATLDVSSKARKTYPGPVVGASPLAWNIDDQSGYAVVNGGQSGVAVVKVDLNGAGATTLVQGLPATAAQNGATSIAADADHVYFGYFDGTQYYLQRVAKTGGAPESLATIAKPNAQYATAGEIQVDGSHVYWSVHAASGVSDAPAPPVGQVIRVAKSGGPVDVLLDKQRATVLHASDATRLYFLGGTDYHRTLLALAK